MSKLLELAGKEKDREKALWAEAKKVVPEQFQAFVLGLEQGKKLSDSEVKDAKLTELGCYAWKGKTYIKQVLPYMSVDGRVTWAQSEGEMEIISQPIEIMGEYFMKATVKTARGTATGFAKINFGGPGVDTTNPVENSETSAVGRALGFLGYGIFGGLGIASYEEVAAAISEREEGKAPDKKDTGKAAETKAGSQPKAEDKAKTEGSSGPTGTEKEEASTFTLLEATSDTSPKGKKYVLAVLSGGGGATIKAYATEEKTMEAIKKTELNKQIKVKLAPGPRGTTLIKELVA
jgi:hypothetical protein